MTENEMILDEKEVQPAPEPEKPSKAEKFKAGFKEWGRKKIVKLKRKPQIIPLLFILITSLIYLLGLRSFSVSAYAYKTSNVSLFGKSIMNFTGLCVFINTLFSLLVMLLMLWSFPKRKKVNKVMLSLAFIFMAVLVVLDVFYYLQMYAMNEEIAKMLGMSVTNYIKTLQKGSSILSSFTFTWTHIVFVGITFVLLATLPLYKKLLMKINTRRVVESNNLTEEIDTSAEV